MKKLTPMQNAVFQLLFLFRNEDVAIRQVYGAAYGSIHDRTDAHDVRHMQQKLGPLLSRINGKLTSGRIRPGDLKQTYRLDTKTKREA